MQSSEQWLFGLHSSAQGSSVLVQANAQLPLLGHVHGQSLHAVTAEAPPFADVPPADVRPPADEPAILVEPPWPEPPPAPPLPDGAAPQRPKEPPHSQVRLSVISQYPDAQSELIRQMLPFEQGLQSKPPQSTSVSLPFAFASAQSGAEHELVDEHQ